MAHGVTCAGNGGMVTVDDEALSRVELQAFLDEHGIDTRAIWTGNVPARRS